MAGKKIIETSQGWQIVEEELTDGSKVYDLADELGDNQIGALNRQAAYHLLEALDRWSA